MLLPLVENETFASLMENLKMTAKGVAENEFSTLLFPWVENPKLTTPLRKFKKCFSNGKSKNDCKRHIKKWVFHSAFSLWWKIPSWLLYCEKFKKCFSMAEKWTLTSICFHICISGLRNNSILHRKFVKHTGNNFGKFFMGGNFKSFKNGVLKVHLQLALNGDYMSQST